MSTSSKTRSLSENLLLTSMSAEEYARFFPQLERIPLHKGKVLYEAGDRAQFAHFVCSGMLSLVSTTEDGQAIEVGMVGNEGVVGFPALLRVNKMPYRVIVQIRGEALRINSLAFKQEFDRGDHLRRNVLCYMHALLTQVTQSAVCNRFHTAEQRLCRWLLNARDRLNSNYLDLTQEFISYMLGTPRNGVSASACALQREGLITYNRGHITIIDLEKLKDASCECYELVAEEYRNFLPPLSIV